MAISQLLTLDFLHHRNSSSVTYRTADPKPKIQAQKWEFGVTAQKVRFGVEKWHRAGVTCQPSICGNLPSWDGGSLARGLTTFLTICMSEIRDLCGRWGRSKTCPFWCQTATLKPGTPSLVPGPNMELTKIKYISQFRG